MITTRENKTKLLKLRRKHNESKKDKVLAKFSARGDCCMEFEWNKHIRNKINGKQKKN